MKANLKSGNAVVRLLLAHGEKIGMAGIVVCTLLLVWSAFGRERLSDEQRPENLQQLVSRADTHIKSFRWEAVDAENKLVSEPVSGEAMKEIPRAGFPTYRTGFDRPTLDPVGLRTDPLLLTAEALEVNGDAGLWVFADPEDIKKKQIQAMADKARLEKEKENERLRRTEEDGQEGPRGARGGGLYGNSTEERGRGRKGTEGGAIVQLSHTGARLQGFEQVEANSWVTLLAKVPVQQQYQHYDDALQNARGYDANSDIPNYKGYQVQRTEITDEGEGEWEIIALVKAKSIEEELDTYPVSMEDVVDPRFNHPVLTHPLPPLILREWDERVSHSSMPLFSERDDDTLEEEAVEESVEEGEEDNLFDSPAISERRDTQRRRRGGGFGIRGGEGRGGFGGGYGGEGRGGYGGEGRGGYGGEGRGGYGGEGRGGFGGEGRGGFGGVEGGYGGGEGGFGRGSSGAISSRQAGTVLSTFTWDSTTSHVLLRYFDSTAEPGHKYRYKVRLGLADVNNISSEQYLDKSVVERRSKLKKSLLAYRFTEWSEPSPIVSVPLPARIYLASAKTAKDTNYNAEPEAEVLIKALNSEYAAEIAYSDFFSRGSVINVRKNATIIRASKYEAEQEPEFDFRTGVTLLDFSGGEELSNRNRDLTAPARVVLMDASGRLSLQTELEDNPTVAEYQLIIEGGKDSRRSSRGGEGGYGEGGGLGGEGGFGR